MSKNSFVQLIVFPTYLLLVDNNLNKFKRLFTGRYYNI